MQFASSIARRGGARTAAAACRTTVAPAVPARGMAVLTESLRADLAEMKKAGTYKTERVITSPQSAHIHVTNSTKDVLVRSVPPHVRIWR
jgi:hypothetical protein